MAGLLDPRADPFGGYLGLLGASRSAADTGGGGLLTRMEQYRAGRDRDEMDRRSGEIMQYGRPLTWFERYTQALPAQDAAGAQETLTNVIGGNFGGPLVGRAVDTAISDVAGGLAGKVGQFFDPRVPEGVIPAPAFHGTPHYIPEGKFELSDRTIGTGEGAQARGHGLYFAESPGVADNYRLQLSGDEKEWANYFDADTGRILNDYGSRITDALDSVVQMGYHPDQARSIVGALEDAITESGSVAKYFDDYDVPAEHMGAFQTAADKLRSIRYKHNPGHVYEVDIPDDAIARMLDLDAPLDEQAPAVQEALQRSGLWGGGIDPKRFNGEALYQDLTERAGSKKAASDFLNAAGIPGNKFWDAGSRGKGEGKRNFVVFDDSLITTVARDGEAL